tara:strand:+ start:1319 stop:2869 length:1551 start_codon:yes stop_codon:yes gene_type:complete
MKLKKSYYILAILVVLSLIKIDYRLDEIPYGLEVDDAEYYYNAVTIGLDLDLDFANQMEGVENRFLNKDEKKIVPFHPVGSGILGAPFVFFGNLFSTFSNDANLISSVYFGYSLASIFYFFLSIRFLQKSLNKLNVKYDNFLLILMIFGTGVGYYAFDRFSMSHVYELFATSFLIYLCATVTNNLNNSSILFSIGFLIFLFLAIRWVNYFLILIPAIVFYISGIHIKKIYTNSYFIFGNLSGLILFLLHTKYLYGIYTLNQKSVVFSVESSFEENYLRFFELEMFFENILFVLKSIRIILFSEEFGLLYFAPILFLSSIFFLMFLLNKRFLLSGILFLVYIFPLLSIIVLQNTAFSYGFRYLFALIPINIILYFKFYGDNQTLRKYLYGASFLGFLLYLFFETSQGTSLSSEYMVNSFGLSTRYSNPSYLSNFPGALISIDSYLHIVFTSFLGVSIIKIINFVIDPVEFLGNFTVINSEVLELIEKSLTFSWVKLIILYLVTSSMTYAILKNRIKK